MNIHRTRALLAATTITAGATLLITSTAFAAEVDNGSFETGDFSGWTVDEMTLAGEWSVYSGTTTPRSDNEIDAPPCGTYAAVTDETEDSSMVLYQDLDLEAGQTHELSFTHYFRNYAGADSTALAPAGLVAQGGPPAIWISPDTLDPNVPGGNQQYRVDIMRPGADEFSVDPSDVLLNVYQSEPGDPAVEPPTEVSVDLSAFAGQTVRLRFAAAVGEDYLNVGVDCVAVESAAVATTTTTAPTTSTTAPAVAAATRPRFTG